MNTLSIDTLVIKTMDALTGAELSNQSAWGTYQRSYWMLKSFIHENGAEYYDIGHIEAFLANMEERVKRNEIKTDMYRNAKRAAKVLVNYAGNGSIDSPVLFKGTRFRLNEQYEKLLADYLSGRELHPNVKNGAREPLAWSFRAALPESESRLKTTTYIPCIV